MKTPSEVLVRLGTERLMLREFEEDDWRAVLAYQADPHYLRYYAWSERDTAAVRQFVYAILDHEWARTRRGRPSPTSA
jgi:ribosomal-protein-alanine N-acetyltransferase